MSSSAMMSANCSCQPERRGGADRRANMPKHLPATSHGMLSRIRWLHASLRHLSFAHASDCPTQRSCLQSHRAAGRPG
jgi:hypothetical protein